MPQFPFPSCPRLNEAIRLPLCSWLSSLLDELTSQASLKDSKPAGLRLESTHRTVAYRTAMQSKGRQRQAMESKPTSSWRKASDNKPNTDSAVLCQVHHRPCEKLQYHDPLHTFALTGQSIASAFPINTVDSRKRKEEKQRTRKQTTSIKVSSTFVLGA